MTDQPQTFRMAVRKFGPFESAMEKLWAKYCLFSGCNIKAELVPMELHELHETTLTNKGLAEGVWDVAHINTDWLHEGYTHRAFEDLSPYIQQLPPADFPQGWSRSLLAAQEFDGHIVGLPFHDGPECLIYRKDLFEDPGEQQNYLMQYGEPLCPPKSWVAFQQVAHFFHRPEKNLYGSVFACYPDGHNTVFDFCLQLWNRGGKLVDENEKVVVDSAEAVEALDFYRTLLKDERAIHPGSANYDSVQAGQCFARGEAALMINWFGFASVCEVDKTSLVKGKTGITVLPVTGNHVPVSLNVYWLYTIGSGSKHKQLAYDFIRFAVNEENDKLLTLEGGIGCRISTWKDREINEVIPYYHKLEQLHEGAGSLPQKHNWAAIAAIIDQAVLAALHSDLPSNILLSKAQSDINLIDQ